MKIFADTADVEAIREAHACGFIDGVTTNPQLVADTDQSYEAVVRGIDEFLEGPISVQVTASSKAGMIEQAREFDTWGDDIAIKIPMTKPGLKALDTLSDEGYKTNATVLFSPVQALFAAKNGATFVSPWWGDVNDAGFNGFDLVRDVIEIYDSYDFDTEVLVASIRNPRYVAESAKIGADIATIPPFVFDMFWENPMTGAFIDNIMDHWGDRGDPAEGA